MATASEQMLELIARTPLDPNLYGVLADECEERGNSARALLYRNAREIAKTGLGTNVDASPLLKSIATQTEYKGKIFSLAPLADYPRGARYGDWDEGRCTYAYYFLLDEKAERISKVGQILAQFTWGGLLVLHEYFGGRDCGPSIYGWPLYLAHLIKPGVALGKPALSWAEKVVLVSTRAFKSSYQGIADYRFWEARRTTGIGAGDYGLARESLKAKKLLTKAGAITAAGRNAIQEYRDIYHIKWEKS